MMLEAAEKKWNRLRADFPLLAQELERLDCT